MRTGSKHTHIVVRHIEAQVASDRGNCKDQIANIPIPAKVDDFPERLHASGLHLWPGDEDGNAVAHQKEQRYDTDRPPEPDYGHQS